MALLANRWRMKRFPESPIQESFLEGTGPYTVETGYHVDPATRDEIIIEKYQTIHNQINPFAAAIHRIEEYWSYAVSGGPPERYERLVYSSAWLPGVNEQRHLILMEHEVTQFWTFSPLADGDNLGHVKRLNAYIIHDTHVSTVTVDSDAEDKLNAQGMTAGSETQTKKIVHTQRLWREANNRAEVIVAPGSRQETEWRENVEIEQDLVDEEPDKWTVWTVRKNALRPGAIELDGPRYVKKTGFQYRLPVPVEPPEITASTRREADGTEAAIRVSLTGGRAVINTPNAPGGPHPIPPDSYSVYRRIVSEPGIDASSNTTGLWSTAPAAQLLPTLIITAPDPTATPSPPTEPHDPSPVDSSDEFEHVEDVDNLAPRDEEALAEVIDTDIIAGGVYEYMAVARIARDDSDLSNVARASYTGTGTTASFRASVRLLVGRVPSPRAQ